MKTPTEKESDTEAEEQELELISRTIDRSRKRLLSPGVLRGELAADRLLQQEAGASPLLKKSKLAVILSRKSGKQLETL